MLLIQRSLANKKYLIVIDGLRSSIIDEWREISLYLPEGEKSRKSIIVTSKSENPVVAMGVAAHRIHCIRPLDQYASWYLFSKVAFSANKAASVDPQFQNLGHKIVEQCEGVPLAIKTVAGLLSTETASLHHWEMIKNNFHDELANKGSVFAVLQMSYDDLPAQLKHCLLCFSIYPEDDEISVEQLVYWWVAEGMVHGNGKETAIEVAYNFLAELVDRCLVERVCCRRYDGRIYTCKMYNLVRDMIIRMAKLEAFSSFDLRNRPKADQESRHLGYASEMGDQILENNAKLRSLLVRNRFAFAQKSGLAKVKSLQVLDLSYISLINGVSLEHLWNWINSQNRLAYLKLQGLDVLTKLPCTKKQQNLQFLVIKECNNLERLPSSVTLLQNLLVLDLGRSHSLQYFPSGLSRLSKLQVLSGLKLANPRKNGARLGELKGLKELRELRISLSKEFEFADDEADSLSGLQKLEVLSIEADECDNEHALLLDKLLPPKSLEELFLRCYDRPTTPKWLSPSTLPRLHYLSIEQSRLRTINTEFWDDEECPWKIEGMCLKLLPSLELNWETIRNNMKYLRYLEINRCYSLKDFPCDVESYGFWEK